MLLRLSLESMARPPPKPPRMSKFSVSQVAHPEAASFPSFPVNPRAPNILPPVPFIVEGTWVIIHAQSTVSWALLPEYNPTSAGLASPVCTQQVSTERHRERPFLLDPTSVSLI